jgi:tetratricopeptide (TPR) repeat protein
LRKILYFCFFIIIVSNVYCNKLNDIIDKSIRYNNWSQARDDLNKYILDNPTDTYAYSLYASVLNELKQYDEAIIAVRNAINYETRDLNKAKLYFNLATYYYSKGLTDVAMQNYLKSFDYDRNLAESYYMLGVIYYQKQDLTLALTNWKSYIDFSMNEDKKVKMKKVVELFEKRINDDKLKSEEDKRQREEFLKNLMNEINEKDAQTKNLEVKKTKETTTDTDIEEIK